MVFSIKIHPILLPILLTFPTICHLVAPPSPQNNPFFQFFKGLTPQQRQQFFRISTNPTLTKPQAQAQFNEFAEQNGIMFISPKDSYISFNNSMNQIKERVEAAAEDNLTGQALKVFNQLKAILNNNSQSHGQVCAQANSVLAKTDQSVVEFLPKGMLAACMGVGNGMAQNVGEEVEEEEEEK